MSLKIWITPIAWKTTSPQCFLMEDFKKKKIERQRKGETLASIFYYR